MTMSDELVTVATFQEPMEANMARSALESAGIEVYVRGEVANSLIPVAFESELQVRAADKADALKLLSAMDDSPASLEDVTAAEVADETAKK
jgi:hypothetical protein